MKSNSFPLSLILAILAHMSLSIESCRTDEDEISIHVEAEFKQQPFKSASSYTKSVQSDSSFKKRLNQMAVSASVSGTYKGFSAGASASYESLTDSVTSTESYSETVQSEKIEFNPDFLQIIREITTRVIINGKSATIFEKKFVDSVPIGEPLSESERKSLAYDYMAREFGQQAVRNKFDETICQEKSKGIQILKILNF